MRNTVQRLEVQRLEPRVLLSTVVAETEVNDSQSQCDRFNLAVGEMVQLQGTSLKRSDKDYFCFTAAEAGTLDFAVQSTGGVTAKLRIEDQQGRKLFASADNGGSGSGSIMLSAGADYFLRLVSPQRKAPAAYLVDLALAGGGGQPPAGAASVAAVAETDPVPHSGDAADDPAVWVHPTDPTQSTIIGTDKDGGIVVYDLAGTTLEYLPDGRMNNVDVRYGFPLNAQLVDLVLAGNRTNSSIAIYQVNPSSRTLENVAARTIQTVTTIYGSCAYHSPVTGAFYFFATSKSGVVEQWELFDNGAGRVDALLVRSFDVGGTTEGCVADDELAYFYAAEETVGIWKYGAEPDAGTARVPVDSTGSAGHLTADVEGLTIYYDAAGTGFLVASSQGSDSFVIYRREGSNEYVGTFKITAGNGIDAVTGTDGIDVVSNNLGSDFPTGLFVVQDGANDGGNQNYKLVSWQDIAAAVLLS